MYTKILKIDFKNRVQGKSFLGKYFYKKDPDRSIQNMFGSGDTKIICRKHTYPRSNDQSENKLLKFV